MNGFHFLCIYHSINIPVILLVNRLFFAFDFFPTADLKHGSLFENVGILLALKIDILAGLATRINNRMTLDVAE
jgi:hypothetical protein